MSIRADAIAVCCALSLLALTPLSAQEKPEPDSPIKSEWTTREANSTEAGDNHFSIELGILQPLAYVDGTGATLPNKTFLGGAFRLAYDKFLTPNFFLGGEASGLFCSTLGKNVLFMLPFGVRAGYQFNIWQFEIPIMVSAGGMLHRYTTTSYFSLFVKPSVGVFWRFNSDWSFGANVAYLWTPEWTATPETTVYGHFLEATLSARYHF